MAKHDGVKTSEHLAAATRGHPSERTGALRGKRYGLQLALLTLAASLGACEGEAPVDPTELDPTNSVAPSILVEALPTNCDQPKDCQVTDPGLMPTCTPGWCSPGKPNGRGIYIVKNGKFCFGEEGKPQFCPSHFVNQQNSVFLMSRLADDPTIEVPARVTLHPIPFVPKAPRLVRFEAQGSNLMVFYETPPLLGVKLATPKELATMQFEVEFFDPASGEYLPMFRYSMRLKPRKNNAPDADGVHRYEMTFRRPGTVDPWAPGCTSPQGAALDTSFLGGLKVDPDNADVSPAQVTTMSCETGAIDTCLSWGYKPWQTELTGDPQTSLYLFRTCLQAKRAAYFVGFGDPSSYTTEGVEIYRRDPFGINVEPYDKLEALWSPRGALCLNREHVRLGDVGLLPGTHLGKLLPCDPLHWTPGGKIATALP
jgi:hypothetical protein